MVYHIENICKHKVRSVAEGNIHSVGSAILTCASSIVIDDTHAQLEHKKVGTYGPLLPGILRFMDLPLSATTCEFQTHKKLSNFLYAKETAGLNEIDSETNRSRTTQL